MTPNVDPIVRTAGELAGDLELSCVDGRHAQDIVGAPGGNAGELVLLLTAAYDQLSKRAEVSVEETFVAYLRAFGRFYLHSDTHAAGNLIVQLRGEGACGLPAEQAGKEALEAFLRHPPVALRPRIEQLLVAPEHVGCGHLQLMLRAPGRYGVRRPVVEAVIRSFYRALWREDVGAHFVLLEGSHQEQAVAVVEEPDGVDDATPLPALNDAHLGQNAFVYHPAAVRFVREKSTRWLAARLLPEADAAERTALTEELLDTVTILGARGLAATLESLAKDLPLVNVPARS